MATRWDRRFFASTRGQVVALLRGGYATVEELARALSLTDNAVRAHLSALEADGLAAQSGVRRGVGKPAFTYALTPDAERLFPKAYGILVAQLLGVMEDRLPAPELEGILREVGHRLAGEATATNGDLRGRVERAVTLLDEMGGMATVEEDAQGLAIVGRSCPIAAAVTGHPEACLMAESMLEDVIGAPVRQVCDTVNAHCRFEIARNGTRA